MADINTLVPDIQKLFQGHSFSEAVDHFSTSLGEQFKERFKEYGEERKASIRMSNYGRPCLRQLWYELQGVPGEPLGSAQRFKFLYGSVLESLLILLAAESGHTVTDLQREIVVDGITGHLDAIIDGVVIDVKSASTYSFNKFKDGSIRQNDPFGYIPQLAGYSHALGGLPGGFLVVDKTLGNIHLELFTAQELKDYDVISRIRTVRQAVDTGVEPLRGYSDEPDGKSGNRKLGTACSYCAFKSTCWKDSNDGAGLKSYYYSTGPRYLTKVVKEPRVDGFNFEAKQ